MEKWIEKIKEAVRVAMNRGLKIKTVLGNEVFYFKISNEFEFYINKKSIFIYTPIGDTEVKYDLTKRDELELKTLQLSIEEYNADIAISELDEFISEKKEEIVDINNLDDDE